MVYPIEEESSCLAEHAIGQRTSELVAFKECLDLRKDVVLGVVTKRPVEALFGFASDFWFCNGDHKRGRCGSESRGPPIQHRRI